MNNSSQPELEHRIIEFAGNTTTLNGSITKDDKLMYVKGHVPKNNTVDMLTVLGYCSDQGYDAKRINHDISTGYVEMKLVQKQHTQQ